MITLRKSGQYKLIETKGHTKVLYLGSDVYAWVEPIKIGEILVISHKTQVSDCVLSMGHYNLYEVEDEPNLFDLEHLELEVGKNHWQGYLLLTGLPDSRKQRSRIIPTFETITGNPRFSNARVRGEYTTDAGDISAVKLQKGELS